MVVTPEDVIRIEVPDALIQQSITVAAKVVRGIRDRADLHARDYLERYINCLMGEIAEQLVLHWLHSEGKFAESTVDKKSDQPDAGHDIRLHDNDEAEILASVKSSLSIYKSTPQEILDNFTLATTRGEVQQVNIQVYFWYKLNPSHRTTVPSTNKVAIFAWAGGNDLGGADFQPYAGEERMAPNNRLKDFRPMAELLNHIT